MSRPLSEIGTVKYGDFTFPAPISLKVQIRPEYTTSGRAIKWRTYHIQLEAVLVGNDFPGTGSIPALSAGDALDKSGSDAMRILRRQLTVPGLSLQIIKQGLGQDLTFTPSGATANVVGYGPKPSILLWEPIGSRQACRIVWTCEVSAVECGTNVLGKHETPLLDFSYTIDFGIAEDGLSTRTVSGVLEVDSRRLGTAAVPRGSPTADEYRHLIVRNIPPLRNFSRRQNYQLSEDRRFLRFSVVDKENESENPLEPHVVRADIEQRISGRWPAAEWNFDFSGTILVAPGRPRELAWAAFVAAIKPRLAAFLAVQLPGESPVGYPSTENSLTLTPRNIDISEKIIGGREMTFHLSFLAVTSLEEIFKTSGLWTPVPGSWGAWWLSMAGSGGPHDSRGIAQLRHTYMEDRIFTVCVPTPSPPSTIVVIPPRRYPGDVAKIFPLPEKDKSWLEYDLKLTILKGNQTILSRRVGNPDGTSVPLASVKTGFVDLGVGGGRYNPVVGDLVIQDRGTSNYRAVLQGSARRAYHKIEPGDIRGIETIDGKPAVAIDDTVLWIPRADRRRSLFIPMYVARWEYVYAIDSPTAKIKVSSHPEVGRGPP